MSSSVDGGFTVWLTGLSGAGKSTLADGLRDELRARGHRVEVLDGDEVRKTLSADLGFSKASRDANVQRVGFVADLLSRNGIIVVAALISPYRDARSDVRRRHGAPFVEVLVDCAITELQRRDPKGLYARAMRGDVPIFTGLSDPYEPPLAPDVHLHTDREGPQQSLSRLLHALETRGLVRPPDTRK